MTLQELDELLDDTRRLPRAQDKVALHGAIASIEIARQLVILNERLAQIAPQTVTTKAKAKGAAK
jgi:hypothetical protein